MGTVRADNFSDGAGTGAPDFATGAKFSGGFDTTGDAGVATNAAHGLVKISDGTAAAAGEVGEILSTAESTDTIFTTGVSATVAEVSLTAGTWLVNGYWQGAFTGTTTQMSNHQISISTVDNTHPAAAGTFEGKVERGGSYATSTYDGGSTAPARVLDLAVTTTVYMVMTATFSAGAARCNESNIWAVRIR